MKAFVYILYSEKLNRFYCGCTDDVDKRLAEPNAGKGKFTRKGVPWVRIKAMEEASGAEAMRLENEIKKREIKRFLNDFIENGE